MANTETQGVTLKVTGMKCGGCESNIKNTLSSINGVLSVEAEHKKDSVSIEFNRADTSLDEIIKAISEAGFTAEDA
jgi:copper chaperone